MTMKLPELPEDYGSDAWLQRSWNRFHSMAVAEKERKAELPLYAETDSGPMEVRYGE